MARSGILEARSLIAHGPSVAQSKNRKIGAKKTEGWKAGQSTVPDRQGVQQPSSISLSSIHDFLNGFIFTLFVFLLSYRSEIPSGTRSDNRFPLPCCEGHTQLYLARLSPESRLVCKGGGRGKGKIRKDDM